MMSVLMQENLSSGFAKNKAADQPAHLCKLISTFLIHFLERIISKLATGEISIFLLVSVAEETGSSIAFFGNPEDRFCLDKAHVMLLKKNDIYTP